MLLNSIMGNRTTRGMKRIQDRRAEKFDSKLSENG